MQTKDQAMVKVRELLSNAFESAAAQAENLIDSGVIDLDSADDDFMLPKVVTVAALRHAADGYVPFDRGLRELIKNLEHF